MAIPQVRVNVQAPFPAFVRGSGPITLAKSAGVWQIGYNVMATPLQAPPLPSFPTDYLLYFDSITGTYNRISLSSLAGAIGSMPTIPNSTVLGNISGANAMPQALTQAQLTALISNFTPTTAGTVPASGASPAAKILHGDGTWSAPTIFTSTQQGEVPASGGGATQFLRADGSWAIPPGGAGAVISVFGRTGAILAQSGDYSFSQISGIAAPAQLPVFTSALNGAVPSSGGGITNFLRADGSWSAVNFAQISGAAGPTQMTLFTAVANGAVPASGGGTVNFLRADGTWQPAPVTSFNGRTGAITPQGADYNFTQITGTVAASQLPLFTPTLNGAVAASGGGTVNFLRADGNWAAPPGGGGGGSLSIGVTTIGGGATGRVLYDNGGILQEYTQAALTAYIVQFTSLTAGTVPASGGGTTSFLRADGTWVAPPSGGAGSIVIGTSTIGGGTSGRVLYDNAGIAGEYTQAQLTAQIQAFAAGTSGAAPASGGGTTNFLRADGTWAAPPAAPVSSVFGRTGAVVAATNDYSFSQISGAASPGQLPLFTATLAGAVSGSGGGTANFLRADGTWVAPPTGTAPVTSVFGRTGVVVAAANDYSFSQISGTATPAQLPLFTSAANGIVAASGGGTVNFLRADGSWASPPGLGSIANNTVLGNVSGVTATPAAITQTQLTALINLFSSTLSGAVPSSGGGTVNYLRADGTWTTVASGSITPIATNTVLGNVTAGTAAPIALSATQLTTLVNPFTATVNGAVPAPGSSTPATNVLQANGSFAAISASNITTGTLPAAQRPAIPPTYSTFSSGSGTYNSPAGVSYIRVRMIGGGGGGGAANNGTAGSNTTFGGWTASGGGGGGGISGATGGAIGVGGSGGGSGTGATVARIGGGNGLVGTNGNSSLVLPIAIAGGIGFFGGSVGAGGQGGIQTMTLWGSGGGGGAGEYAEFQMAPGSYARSVGGGGPAGASGAGITAGTAGANGLIIVEEWY